MCILFMYVANVENESPSNGKRYKLILASNRDEKYSRPTAQAKFWDGDDSHILAGQDLEELGTWLGVSKNGKLAVLLNIMGKSLAKENATSRGTLVTGFLRSPPELPGCMYLKSLCQEPENLDISDMFNPFHLITVDLLGQSEGSCSNDTGAMRANQKLTELKNGGNTHSGEDNLSSIRVTYLANSKAACVSSRPQPHNLTPPTNESQFHAFGNSTIDEAFQKVTCGRKEFEKIVNEHLAGDNDDDSLVDGLLDFLKSERRFFPDENMEKRGKETKIPSKILPFLSSIFIKLSVAGIDYGTRTHTIILVDTENNVTFHEWTMKEPIDSNNPEWSHVKYAFNLNCNKL